MCCKRQNRKIERKCNCPVVNHGEQVEQLSNWTAKVFLYALLHMQERCCSLCASVHVLWSFLFMIQTFSWHESDFVVGKRVYYVCWAKKRVTMMWTSQIWHGVPHHSGEVDDLIIGLLAVRDKTSARTPSSVHWWDLQAYCQSWIRHTKHFIQTVIAYMSHNVKMCAQSAVWIQLHIYTVYTFQLKLRSEHI